MFEKPVVRFCNTLSRKDVVDLCQLKEQHWPKGLKKQIFWWFFLTNKQDRLVLIENSLKKIGFLRLKLRKVMQDSRIKTAYTISELCVDKEFQKQGLGTKILKKSQAILKKEQISGYLLSEDIYKNFYNNLGWTPIKNVITLDSNMGKEKVLDKNKTCYFYNLKDFSKNIKLIGKIF